MDSTYWLEQINVGEQIEHARHLERHDFGEALARLRSATEQYQALRRHPEAATCLRLEDPRPLLAAWLEQAGEYEAAYQLVQTLGVAPERARLSPNQLQALEALKLRLEHRLMFGRAAHRGTDQAPARTSGQPRKTPRTPDVRRIPVAV